jgi:hypothetical protein
MTFLVPFALVSSGSRTIGSRCLRLGSSLEPFCAFSEVLVAISTQRLEEWSPLLWAREA